MTTPLRRFGLPQLVVALLVSLLALAPPASAHPELTGDPAHDDDPAHQHDLAERDPAASLEARDRVSETVVSAGPTGKRIKNLALVGEGERLVENATTDVWVHDGYAYLGTFNAPCGTGEGFEPGVAQVDLIDDVAAPGVPIFEVRNPNRPRYLGNLPSVEGSRVNDVKVADLNGGTILVHSNEACDGGPGGFEIYDVSDPRAPVHLASVRVGDVNETVRALFGTDDVGVHNLFLFSQGERDYVAAVVDSWFDNFQVFDITDPSAPTFAGSWGAERLSGIPDVQSTDDVDVIIDAVLNPDYGLLAGYGSSANRFLHDITVTADGTLAYLSNWDAGLVLLGLADVANPQVVSVALDVEAGSLDGEVNSHAAWPSEDGRIVVETEEDFDAWEVRLPPDNLTFGDDDPDAPLPGTAVSTVAGDDFEANPTGNVGTVTGDQVVVESGPLAGTTYPAIELLGDQPALPEAGITGELVFVGRLCDGDPVLNAGAVDPGDVAVVRRGECVFREKNLNAAELGAAAVVIANNETESTPWAGVRIWDYSDPANPVLASTFYTECAAAATPIPGCDPAGTYSVHNVIVERQGNRTLAYISWYSDGMVVLDVTDPYAPVEVARFFDDSAAFRDANGGAPHDYWGVYKVPQRPFIYGSDRNGGLDVFKLLGKGTIGKSTIGKGQGRGAGGARGGGRP
ncbi:MAG: hypothetical protein KY452_05105 [Actinobacteria bacterium]|nr:hypothetical protein [Actinomycetota bacterium]